MAEWENPDVGLLFEVNRLAQRSPEWVDRVVVLLGVYGLPALAVVLLVVAWRGARVGGARQDAVTGVAGVLWAALAAGLAFLVNVPIRQFVARRRPADSHEGVDVLLDGTGGYSFVSDHTAVVMALGVGLFMVGRRLGLSGIALALLEGLFRIYAGVHYPTDVVGALALGTAVALLPAPGALALLTWLTRWVADGPVGRVVWSRAAGGPGRAEHEGPGAGDREAAGAVRPAEETEPAEGLGNHTGGAGDRADGAGRGRDDLDRGADGGRVVASKRR